MHSFKTDILAGTSILLLSAMFSAPVFAATVTGGGSSLISPFIAEALACYVDPDSHAKSWPGGSSFTCPGGINPVDLFNNVASNSGNGLLAAYSRDPAVFNTFAGTTFASVAYGLSDAALTQNDIDIWNFGTNHMFPLGHVPPVTPSGFQGKTFQSGGNYPVPLATYGALIQIPVSIDPVAIGYSPNFASGSGHAFQIHTADGNIHLDRAAYCGIFNGDITDWNDAGLSSLNSTNATPHSLTGGISAPIHVIGRSDQAGTTFILSRHLANVCTGVSTDNYYVDGPSNLPINGAHQLPNGVTFTVVIGDNGVAGALNNTPGSISYIGPSYLLPAAINTHADSFNLPAAILINAHNSTAYAPNGTNAAVAFGTILPPQSDINGNYDNSPPMSTNDRTDPLLWIPGTANSTIDDPTVGYPIVGTTNIVLSQHYDAGRFLALAGQVANFDPYDGSLTNYYDNNNPTICMLLLGAGLGCLPSTWNTAITESFITGADGLGHEIMTP